MNKNILAIPISELDFLLKHKKDDFYAVFVKLRNVMEDGSATSNLLTSKILNELHECLLQIKALEEVRFYGKSLITVQNDH